MDWWGDWFKNLTVATPGESREEGEPVWINTKDRSIEIEPTLVLAPYAELAWAQTVAARIAGFLQVPLLQRV